MGKTSIEWTDASWNPIVGCTEISPGCANCYAARLAATRLRNTPQYKGLTEIVTCHNARMSNAPTKQRWTGDVRFLPERLEEPLHWKKPRRIFVCDMGDLFHESVQDEWIAKIFGEMSSLRRHTFQVLTKRPARMQAFLNRGKNWEGWITLDGKSIKGYGGFSPILGSANNWPPRNVWLGVSVENQHFADERIPLLLATPAAMRWISAEPLLGPVYLKAPIDKWRRDHMIEDRSSSLDWVVCGGESGPNARAMHPDWARALRDQCHDAGVPFFFKQWGEFLPVSQDSPHLPPKETDDVTPRKLMREFAAYRVGKKKAGRLLDGREWNDFPKLP